MWEEQSMGSQTLEILRQGVWASITGGWFYDPSQDVFCNTFHLYLWLFLLCLPFSIYVYFPPTKYMWYFYCSSVTVALATIKLANYFLHHIYDTKECIHEVDAGNSSQKRDEEGIELQDFSTKRKASSRQGLYEVPTSTSKNKGDAPKIQELPNKPNDTSIGLGAAISHLEYSHVDGGISTSDSDSTGSMESQRLDAAEGGGKPSSTIDLKADVHRKNSSESSGERTQTIEVVTHEPPLRDNPIKKSDKKSRHQRSDDYVSVTIKEEKNTLTNFRKLYPESSTESQYPESGILIHHRPSLHSVESEQSASNLLNTGGRRHSNFTNSSLNYLPISIQANMKPTGSLELGYIDKNPNEALVSEGYYFKPRSGVRRIRSTALETCCPPPALQAHPNSLEVIGCKSARNPLPPPSSSLVRNQHLNLCPYYGSEIVYPIAEQSDEHQTSHGPDSDIDSLPRASDSDFEENNQGSHSPLLYIRLKKPSQVPYTDKRHQTKMHKVKDEERTSATSKDALLDMDHSNSSATPEMHDARGDCYATDNDVSDKKLSEGSNLSCSSVEYDERTDHKHKTTKLKSTWDNSEDNTYKITDSDLKICDVDIRDRSADYRVCELDNRGRESEYRTCGDLDDRDRDRAKKFTDSECRVCDLDERSHTSGKHTASGGEVKIVRKKNVRKNKRKRSTDSKAVSSGNCSSLVELDLDWLFDENIRLPHRKEPLKKDTEWSITTTVSLEHDVSKVLQEPVPSMRSLGAIPKKTARSSSHGNEFERRPPRSESEKCRACRCKPDDKKTKENKLTQTLSHGSLVPEDLDCAVFSPAKMHRGSIPKRGYIKYQQQVRYEEASSSGSNNELSTLLTPSAPLLSALLNTRRELPSSTCPSAESTKIEMSPSCQHRGRLRRARVSRKRSSQLAKRESAIACSLSAGYGTHSAKNFNDTTDGAVHCFMDEHGNWITYTFDEKSVGTVNAQMPSEPPANERGMRRRRNEGTTNRAKSSDKCEVWDSNSADSACSSSVSTIVDGADIRKCVIAAYPRHLRSMLPEDRSRRRTIQVNSQTVNLVDLTLDNIDRNFIIIDRDNSPNRTKPQFKLMRVNPDENTIRTKSYYKFNISPWSTVKLTFDRLKLLALLDRNLTLSETVLSILLGILVAVLGAILLFLDFYKDVLAFIFCFVIASCQYSLLKSVQPDAASPTHGFNRVIAYSRPIYFCLFSALVLVLHYNSVDESLTFYRDFFIAFILFFPLVFSLGLFPQINTFTLYLLEQFDIHIFGGNAMSSLVASFYCIFRSILTVIILNGLAYAGLNEEKSSQNILFSIFCSCLIGTCYHLSRSASDPSHVWNLVKKHLWMPDMYREAEIYKREEKTTETKDETDDTNPKTKDVEKSVTFNPDTKEPDSAKEHVDPLPHKLQKTVNARLTNDAILCSLIAVLVFGIHASTVFTALQPELSPVLWCIAAILGFLLHYIIPQLRKQLPWMCIARPIFRSHEHDQYQIRGPANIMWFERIYIYLCFFERNILYPLLFLSTLTEDSPRIVEKYGLLAGSFITVICGLKCLRCSYSDQNSQYLIVTFTALFFKYDYSFIQETFLVEYFFMSIAFYKFYELLLKVQFVITYIAPWQITWGSAFHAFAQPFSVPHSAMLFLQALISAAFSTPLNPFLGSAIFFTSYVRPVKFWERDYNTRRVDHSNTPLSSHLDRNLGADDNNLNSIFYEHLTRSLQHSLYGDLALGRWGPVSQGDIFVMASDYLNCLVHIIEIGNGLVTFQVRGLEFRGTYCQQREVEAITEGVEENDGCCCCDTGHLPNMLSINAAFSQRWLAWEVTASKYILEGYSISDNSVVSMLQVFEFRKVLVSYYVKSIIFYTVRSAKLEEWLTSQVILKALQPMEHRNFVDLDPVFNYNIDEDYDMQHSGMTVSKFVHVHGVWINYCIEKSERNLDAAKKMSLTLLCFALSLLGRRTLGAVSHNMVSSVEFFLYGLHALFKGDFRITCTRDEWVFTDMDLLKTVVAPGVRMSLKLHQDHFMSPDEYDELPALYDAICKHEEELVISHEGDPAWRTAVLSGTPSLLALRHVFDEGSDEYKIIMLNKRYLSFRIIKINRECVRGLWAGQQQELVYLRNRNPERGSIQNAKQALRNIINSSCDQPIGYPIYVSPLTTSYAETNEQYCSLIGGAVSLTKIRDYVFNLFRRIRKRCGEGCSSGASNREEIGMGHDGVYAMTPISFPTTGSQSIDGSHLGGSIGRGSSLSRASLGGNRGSLVSVGKPTSSTLASLAGLFKERDERAISQAPDAQTRADERFGDVNDVVEKEFVASRVRIVDPNLVYDCINLGRRIDVSWPTEYMRCRGGRSHWKDWVPETGMEGPIVHKWTPGHKDLNKRSHVDRTIVLVQIDDKFVPISENGVQDLGPEVRMPVAH